jgi:hypothetical protein
MKMGILPELLQINPRLLESIGTDTFSYSPAGIEIHFKESKMSLL